MRYSDNIRPASPAMTRALVMINRAFANPWGKEKSRARQMCGLGPRSQTARARYGDIAADMKREQASIHAAILHLRWFRTIEKAKTAPNPYQLGRHLEALMLLRWLRRHNPRAYYPIRDALTNTSTIVPRSW